VELLEDRCLLSIAFTGETVGFSQSVPLQSPVELMRFFDNDDPFGDINNFTLRLDWGDGTTPTTGTLVTNSFSSNGSSFTVLGSHRYDQTGQFTITATVHDIMDNFDINGTSTAVVVASNQGFLNSVYMDLLNRPIDSIGMAVWNGALTAGATRPQVVQAIEASQEYRADAVEAVYQNLLGRPADPTGLNAFVNFLGNGGTIRQVQESIFGSPEYFQGHGKGSNAGFVNSLYQDVLGRNVDPTGAAFFGAQLAQGTARSVVAHEVLTSSEAETDFVQAAYQQYLQRQADSVGLNFWVGALQAGTTNEQVVGGIVGSQEYFILNAGNGAPRGG
jgi:hypothetical protein